MFYIQVSFYKFVDEKILMSGLERSRPGDGAVVSAFSAFSAFSAVH